VGPVEDSGQFISFIGSEGIGRVPFFPDGDEHEAQEHGVGDTQDGVDKAGHVVVFLAPRGRDEALHQHQPTDRNYHRYSDYQESGDDAHYRNPPYPARLLMGSRFFRL
jgi:hypothetical protein